MTGQGAVNRHSAQYDESKICEAGTTTAVKIRSIRRVARVSVVFSGPAKGRVVIRPARVWAEDQKGVTISRLAKEVHTQSANRFSSILSVEQHQP